MRGPIENTMVAAKPTVSAWPDLLHARATTPRSAAASAFCRFDLPCVGPGKWPQSKSDLIRHRAAQIRTIRAAFDMRSGCRPFQLDCARKEDVVLQMNVLVQVLLEFLETFVKGMKGRTGILGRRKIMA